MARPIGSKNSKPFVFAFKSADDRAYFVRTNLPVDAEYTVFTQPSLFNAGINWFYLKLVVAKPVSEVKNAA
jgi:hypothetical protein